MKKLGGNHPNSCWLGLLQKCDLDGGLNQRMTSQIRVIPESECSTFFSTQTHAHTQHPYTYTPASMSKTCCCWLSSLLTWNETDFTVTHWANDTQAVCSVTFPVHTPAGHWWLDGDLLARYFTSLSLNFLIGHCHLLGWSKDAVRIVWVSSLHAVSHWRPPWAFGGASALWSRAVWHITRQ